MLTTHVAAAVAATTWMTIEWVRFGRPSALGIVTGSLAGLVAITPACGFVSPLGAIVIALVATVACYLACSWLKQKLRYDHSLDVFGVHGVAGLVGTLLLGVFGTKAFGGIKDIAVSQQLPLQMQGVLVTVLWAAIGTTVVCLVVKAIIGFRVGDQVEHAGVDLHQHGEVAYSIEDRP
jgi:Amt family ammonium transporter